MGRNPAATSSAYSRTSIAWPRPRALEDHLGERLAAGHQQLQRDQVEPGDHLGDGMLHLEARVHLEEPERAVGFDEELHGARVGVADRAGQRDRSLADALAQLVVQRRGGRFLDDLLVAPLDRAVALEEVDQVAVGVAEDLDLDVAGAIHESFDEERAVTERGGRLGPRRLQRVRELLGRGDDAHPAPAAARRRLHEERVTDVVADRHRVDGVAIGDGDRRAARARRPATAIALAATFDPIVSITSGAGPTKREARGGDGPGEVGVLGEEAVAGMHGIGAGAQRGGDDRVDVEVGVGRARTGKADRFVGEARRSGASASTSENTATVPMPSARARCG